MEKDLTAIYLKGTYDEREKWVIKINNKIKELNEDIEYQKKYGNVAKREKLEFEKNIYIELLEDKQ